MPPVRNGFPYSRVSRNRKTTKSLENVIISRDFVVSPVSRHFLYSKVSRNKKTTKSLEIMIFSRNFVVFLFLDTFRMQGMLLFLLFPDTYGKVWEVVRLEDFWPAG